MFGLRFHHSQLSYSLVINETRVHFTEQIIMTIEMQLISKPHNIEKTPWNDVCSFNC